MCCLESEYIATDQAMWIHMLARALAVCMLQNQVISQRGHMIVVNLF